MDVHGRLQYRNSSAARDRHVNAIWDDVGQAVAGKGGNEAERALRNPVGDFEKVVIGRRRIDTSIQAAPHLLEMPLIAVAVEAFCGESGGYRVRVGEDGR